VIPSLGGAVGRGSNGRADRALPGPGNPPGADPIGWIRSDQPPAAGLDSLRPGLDPSGGLM